MKNPPRSPGRVHVSRMSSGQFIRDSDRAIVSFNMTADCGLSKAELTAAGQTGGG